jgi:hypothetical protein
MIIIIIFACDLFAAIGSFIYYFVLNSKLQRRKLEVFFFFFFLQRKKEKKKSGGSFKGLSFTFFRRAACQWFFIELSVLPGNICPKKKHPSSFKKIYFIFLNLIFFKLFKNHLKILRKNFIFKKSTIQKCLWFCCVCERERESNRETNRF